MTDFYMMGGLVVKGLNFSETKSFGLYWLESLINQPFKAFLGRYELSL